MLKSVNEGRVISNRKNSGRVLISTGNGENKRLIENIQPIKTADNFVIAPSMISSSSNSIVDSGPKKLIANLNEKFKAEAFASLIEEAPSRVIGGVSNFLESSSQFNQEDNLVSEIYSDHDENTVRVLIL